MANPWKISIPWLFNWKIQIDVHKLQPALDAIKPQLIATVCEVFTGARQSATWKADKLELEIYKGLTRLTSEPLIIMLLYPIVQTEIRRLTNQVNEPLWRVEEDLIEKIRNARL